MAITVDYVVLHHLKKTDGTNFIRLRITHKRKSKYIKTNICVLPEDFTRSGNLKHQGKKDLADDEVRKYRKVVDGITTSAANEMDVDEVLRYIEVKLKEKEEFRLNFASFGMQVAERKKASTAHNYRVAIRSLVRFFGHEPDISEITVKALRRYEEFIRSEPRMVYDIGKDIVRKTEKPEKPKGGRAVNQYLGVVASVYRSARMEFNEPDLGIYRIPGDPFEYYQIPQSTRPDHRDIPAEWVQMMIDQRRSLEGLERFGVDLFLISFGLQGMNMVDMYELREHPQGNIIHYYRHKTKDSGSRAAEMYVRIEPCIREIMKDYLGKERMFRFHQMYATRLNMTVAVNNGLKRWYQRNGIDRHFTFYSARHTWPTLAASKRLQIESSVITDALAHSDRSRKMDKVYIRQDWERIWDANAQVLALFDWGESEDNVN